MSVCLIVFIKFVCKGEVAFKFVNSGGLTFSSVIFKAVAQHGTKNGTHYFEIVTSVFEIAQNDR